MIRPVSKTGRPFIGPREFESHPLRQFSNNEAPHSKLCDIKGMSNELAARTYQVKIFPKDVK